VPNTIGPDPFGFEHTERILQLRSHSDSVWPERMIGSTKSLRSLFGMSGLNTLIATWTNANGNSKLSYDGYDWRDIGLKLPMHHDVNQVALAFRIRSERNVNNSIDLVRNWLGRKRVALATCFILATKMQLSKAR
jgi:hypothetical protein